MRRILYILALLLFFVPVLLGQSLVNHVSIGGDNHGFTFIFSPTFTVVTPGDFLIVVVTIGHTGEPDPQTCQDFGFTSHNTYNELASTHLYNGSLFSGSTQVMYYASNISGGTGQVQCQWLNSGGGYAEIFVGEFSGMSASPLVDQQTATNGSATNPSISITNILSPDLITANYLVGIPGAACNNLTPITYGNVPSTFCWGTTVSSGLFTATTAGGLGTNPYVFSIASFGVGISPHGYPQVW